MTRKEYTQGGKVCLGGGGSVLVYPRGFRPSITLEGGSVLGKLCPGGVRTYFHNAGLWAEPRAGSRGRAFNQGVWKALRPEAESLLAF